MTRVRYLGNGVAEETAEGFDEKGEWQLCPKCNGQGRVSKPPYIAGDINEWSSSETSFECDVCNGQKILARPLSASKEQPQNELWEQVEKDLHVEINQPSGGYVYRYF